MTEAVRATLHARARNLEKVIFERNTLQPIFENHLALRDRRVVSTAHTIVKKNKRVGITDLIDLY